MREPFTSRADAVRGEHSPRWWSGSAPHERSRLRTLVVGVGSDIRADDGVGLHVARYLEGRLASGDAEVMELGTAGLSLLDSIRGYDRLILIDAIVTGAEPGTVHVLDGADVARASHLGPGHDADLPTVLALGEKLAADQMPRDVIVVAIEAADVVSVSTQLTPAVEAAVPAAAAKVEDLCG